jgi:ParB family chromosome partitioning protein
MSKLHQPLTFFDDRACDGKVLEKPQRLEPVTSREALHSSQSVEWYTPPRYVEAVRRALGSIDLDPASCAFANQTVKAKRYFDLESDGLVHDWSGKVFLNPPYGKTPDGRSRQQIWSEKLLQQYGDGITTKAILLVNAATGDRWFQDVWQSLSRGSPVCFTRRIKFHSPGGQPRQPTHGNVFMYFGQNSRRFAEVFEPLGVIVARIV